MKGTKELRRTIKGVGLIRVASGTHSAKLYDRMNERITQLAEARRLDWLRAIRDKLMEPAEWFERTSVGDFSQLGSPMVAPFTARKIEAWAEDFEASDRHRTDVRLSLLRLAKKTRDATNLPAVLKKARASYKAAGKAVAFNRMKAHVQTYLRDTVTINHPAYLAVRAIRNLPVAPKRAPFPCTVAQAVEIARGLGASLGAVWLTMCVTGAGPKELWEDGLSVDVATGHLRIAGQKRRSRNRLVPLVTDLGQLTGRPAFPYRLLRERLSTLTEARVEPYDARRTYAKWLTLAGVPLPHQDAYLGHGPRTMTGLYQQGNEAPYLAADAERIASFIRAELAKSERTIEERAYAALT